ncbi:MAG: ATPase [Leeuwenhoekiella sp.]
MENPSKITEGGVEFSLGSFDGKKMIYDFEKILIYLDAKGKLLFGKHFKIHDQDRPTLFKLCNYFIRDYKNCEAAHIDLQKGILLLGPIGCGKTTLMKLLRHLVPFQKSYEVIACRNIIFSFNHLGYKTIEDYGSSKFFCFDDLGIEMSVKHFGQNCEVMGEILLSRYDLLTTNEKRFKTHITSNLDADQIEERYGNRVRSRIREMCNVIAFDKNTNDKRR